MRTVLASLLLVAGAAATASAATQPTFLPANGDRLHVQITRSSQGFDQPVIARSDLVVQRKSGDTLLVERTQNGATVDSVLTIDPNGQLQLAASERNLATNADLRPLLPVLEIALDVAQGAAPPGGTVLLPVPVGEARTTSTVVVPLKVADLVGNDFALHGSATTQLQPGGANASASPSPEQSSPRRRGGFGGFPGGGGGFPGGGFPSGGGGRSDGAGPRPDNGGQRAAANPMNVLVRIDGQVAGGRVRRLTIAQMRQITVGGTPFVNADSWTIEVQ